MDFTDFLNLMIFLILTVFIVSVSYFIIKIANTPIEDFKTYKIETIKKSEE